MPAPELLLIKRMEDLQTALIGRCEIGQFFVAETVPVAGKSDPKLPEKDRLYVVRYLFKLDGEFIGAEHAKINCCSERDYLRLTEDKKGQFLDGLGPYEFCDIAVKPFSITIDEIQFGLIYNSKTGSISLEPGSTITFMEPWDGEYYT
jgi:formate hydrogenlyase regulatory protein HycA